jgi:hypothetical protein
MAELQKGHIYYRCHTRSCATKTVREERVDAALGAAFAPLHLNEEEAAYIQKWFVWARANMQERNDSLLEACRLQLSQLHDRLARLTDAFLDGAIDKVFHAERRASFIVEEAALKQKMRDLEAGRDESLPNLEEYLELIQSASNLHKMTLVQEKRALVKKLTSNLSVGPGNPTITLQNEAQLIADRPKVLSSSPNRGVPRTWKQLLPKLLKKFEHEELPFQRVV